MKAYTFLATSILVVMVSCQSPQEPFDNPGEIIPEFGLTISYLINAAGGIWQQDRVIDSLAYACTDVLPSLGSMIPDVDSTSLYWGPICDQVIEAADDLNAFDAEGFCTEITDMINDLIYQDTGTSSYMEYPGSMTDGLDIIGILINTTRELYGIDINDLSTINTTCNNVKDDFLRPSLQDLISQFGTELMSVLLPEAVPLCQDWNGFLQRLNVNSPSPYYPIIQDGAHIASQAVGYDNRDELCQNLQQALSVQDDNKAARKTFSMGVISNFFAIPEESDTCSTLANDVISEVIEPLFRINSDGFEITNAVIHKYTGIERGVTGVCTAVENAFTNIVDLPDPVPVQLITGTTLTVEFLMNAAGGIWQQDRLIDSVAFVCTDILPDLESTVPVFKSYIQDTWDYGPVCNKVLGAARDLEAFDATEFCNDVTAMVIQLINEETGERIRRQGQPLVQDPFDVLNVLANVTKGLYNIDINDQTTICPNVGQLLSRSIPDIISELMTELMVVYLPRAAPFCKDWDATLQKIGIDFSSPYYQVIQEGARIGSQVVGYESREDLCQDIDQVLSATGDGNTARRTFARNVIESSYDIYTNKDRCSTYATDVIDDIIEPIIRIVSPDDPLTINDYTIYRYTGFMGGVEGVCRAMETAFTQLSESTVRLTITGEILNGEELVYSDDLKNKESPRFKNLENVYCGAIENHLKDQLGSHLRRLDCIALSFSLGSVVAELQLELYATTQDVADSLAQDVADLSTTNSLTLSSDGNILEVSSIKPTADVGRRGLSTGAIIGIVIAAIVVFMLLVFIIICFMMHSVKARKADAERGPGIQNKSYAHDEKERYGK